MRLSFRHLWLAISLTVLQIAAPALLSAQSTPTATFKAYYDAAKKKDFAAMKRLMSARDLNEIAKAPIAPERMMELLVERVPPVMPETRNERITGDRASLEVLRAETKEWETTFFVHENGMWKISASETK